MLALVPLLVGLYVYSFRRKSEALAAFATSEMLARIIAGTDPRRQKLKAGLVVAAVAMLAVAMTQPQWGRSTDDVSRHGRDLVFMVDVSLSMLAEDAAPNRLEVAKQALVDLAKALRNQGGHRLALVAFAGRASLQTPLTVDYDLFERRLETIKAGMVSAKGSMVGVALRQTLAAYIAPEDLPYTDVIMLTDGEDHDAHPLEAADFATQQGVTVHTVGIGSTAGAPIPLADGDKPAVNLRHQGEEVRTRLQQGLLIEMARMTGGQYLGSGIETPDLVGFYYAHINDKPRRALAGSSGQAIAHRYQWFVLTALLLLIADMILRERRETVAST